MGATAIWTTPVYDNNDKPDTKEVYPGMPYTTGYHGYGAVDMYAVDEHLGDMAKLKEFVRKAHQSGLIVLQDQVVNHVGPYHVWANDPPTPTWFNGTVEKHLNNNWQKWTAMNPRATYQTQARNIDGWFIDILPDLNQRDPGSRKISDSKYFVVDFASRFRCRPNGHSAARSARILGEMDDGFKGGISESKCSRRTL